MRYSHRQTLDPSSVREPKQMTELLPCPFCNLEPRPTEDTDMRPEYKGHIYGFTIFCESCGISMTDEYWEVVKDAWNTRTDHKGVSAHDD